MLPVVCVDLNRLSCSKSSGVRLAALEVYKIHYCVSLYSQDLTYFYFLDAIHFLVHYGGYISG